MPHGNAELVVEVFVMRGHCLPRAGRAPTSAAPASTVEVDVHARLRRQLQTWDSYQAWQSGRNRARAELESRHGYDTKHAMHLIRLMRMGLEILEDGNLLVRRPDAAELSAIRDGAMTFEQLLAAAVELQAAMERAASTTKQPDDVDRAYVDRLALRLISE